MRDLDQISHFLAGGGPVRTAALSGVEVDDSVAVSGADVANLTDVNADSNKVITVSGFTIANANYSLTQPRTWLPRRFCMSPKIRLET
jgi:hypothetical protein